MTRVRAMVCCRLPAPATSVCTQVRVPLPCWARAARSSSGLREIRGPRLRLSSSLVRKALVILSFSPCVAREGVGGHAAALAGEGWPRCDWGLGAAVQGQLPGSGSWAAGVLHAAL